MYLYKRDKYSNQRFMTQVPFSLYILIHDHLQNELKDTLKDIIEDIECIKYMRSPLTMYDFHKYWNVIQNEEISIDRCFKRKLNGLIFSNRDQNKSEIAGYYHDIAMFMMDTSRYNDIEYFLQQLEILC